MTYEEYTPHTLLKPYIDRYFSMKNEHALEKAVQLNLPPNGTSGILFQCGNFYKVTNRSKHMSNLSHAFVMGQQIECFKVEISGKFNIIGVHFTPTGLNRMFGIPIHELTNQGADADQLLGNSINQIGEKIWDFSEASRKVAELEAYLYRHLLGCETSTATAEHAVDKILQTGGQTEITDISRQLQVSRRTLERHFLRSVGMYPKQFSQITRLNQLFKLAQRLKNFSWHDLIYTCGYYDQSHFIRNFQTYMRQTPTHYWESLKKNDRLRKSVITSCRGITSKSRNN